MELKKNKELYFRKTYSDHPSKYQCRHCSNNKPYVELTKDDLKKIDENLDAMQEDILRLESERLAKQSICTIL